MSSILVMPDNRVPTLIISKVVHGRWSSSIRMGFTSSQSASAPVIMRLEKQLSYLIRNCFLPLWNIHRLPSHLRCLIISIS
jgi:hypothetical protein